MVDFVNPGLLDTYAKFKREFEGPIARGRQPGGTKKVVEMGVARGETLGKITGEFVLRRMSEILAKYLPMKCTPRPTWRNDD
jgi:DNA repair and recombination protein RAD54B